MENNAVAWMPPTYEKVPPDLLAIWHPPIKKLTSDAYQALLAIRFQNLVDAQENPQEAVDEAVEILTKAGAFSPYVTVPADEAGSILIYSNLAIPEFLSLRGVLPGPYEIKEGSGAAEMALLRDKEPEGRVREIAMHLVNLPT